MEVQLEDCSNCIGNTRVDDDQIVQHLQGLINDLKIQQTFPFTTNLKVYRSPQKESTPEQLALIENVYFDNALKRTFNLDACVIVNRVSRIETFHFCVIRFSKVTNTLFYVGFLNTLTVQRWTPNAIAKH